MKEQANKDRHSNWIEKASTIGIEYQYQYPYVHVVCVLLIQLVLNVYTK